MLGFCEFSPKAVNVIRFILHPDLVDSDDEDGIEFLTPLIPGQEAAIRVTVTGNGGFLNGWFDFEGDGDFLQGGNQVFDGLSVVSGTTTLTFTVPVTATPGITTYSRFRLSTVQDLDYQGLARDGEVEDYALQIGPLLDLGDLPDDYSRMLFETSSPLTPTMRALAKEHGFSPSEGARSFVLNADMVLLVQAIDIGTRPSNLR